MQIKLETDRILTNFLRSKLTDPNSSRSGHWIFPDFPRVNDLGDTSFPRIGITLLSETSDSLGIFDNNQYETINIQIDVVTKKNLKFSVTTTDEALGTMGSDINTDRLSYTYIPNTITNIKHDGSAYGTVTKVNTDADFTAPGSLTAGTVQWAYSTGRLNFSAADVAAHDTDAITSTSVVVLEGKKLCQYLAREVIRNIRTNWRTDNNLKGLFYPIKIDNFPVPFDEDLGLFRQTIEYQFRAFNIGEGL